MTPEMFEPYGGKMTATEKINEMIEYNETMRRNFEEGGMAWDFYSTRIGVLREVLENIRILNIKAL